MNEERAGRCLRQVEHIHGNMLASFKHYNPNQELPFYPMYIKPIHKKVSLKTTPPLMKYMINYLHSQVLGIVGHF
jgi:hypothetical protein